MMKYARMVARGPTSESVAEEHGTFRATVREAVAILARGDALWTGVVIDATFQAPLDLEGAFVTFWLGELSGVGVVFWAKEIYSAGLVEGLE